MGMPRSCRWCQRPASRTIVVDAPDGAPARMALCDRHLTAVARARHDDPETIARRRRDIPDGWPGRGGGPRGGVGCRVRALPALAGRERGTPGRRRGPTGPSPRALPRARLDESAFKKRPASIRGELSGAVIEQAIGDI